MRSLDTTSPPALALVGKTPTAETGEDADLRRQIAQALDLPPGELKGRLQGILDRAGGRMKPAVRDYLNELMETADKVAKQQKAAAARGETTPLKTEDSQHLRHLSFQFGNSFGNEPILTDRPPTDVDRPPEKGDRAGPPGEPVAKLGSGPAREGRATAAQPNALQAGVSAVHDSSEPLARAMPDGTTSPLNRGVAFEGPLAGSRRAPGEPAKGGVFARGPQAAPAAAEAPPHLSEEMLSDPAVAKRAEAAMKAVTAQRDAHRTLLGDASAMFRALGSSLGPRQLGILARLVRAARQILRGAPVEVSPLERVVQLRGKNLSPNLIVAGRAVLQAMKQAIKKRLDIFDRLLGLLSGRGKRAANAKARSPAGALAEFRKQLEALTLAQNIFGKELSSEDDDDEHLDELDAASRRARRRGKGEHHDGQPDQGDSDGREGDPEENVDAFPVAQAPVQLKHSRATRSDAPLYAERSDTDPSPTAAARVEPRPPVDSAHEIPRQSRDIEDDSGAERVGLDTESKESGTTGPGREST